MNVFKLFKSWKRVLTEDIPSEKNPDEVVAGSGITVIKEPPVKLVKAQDGELYLVNLNKKNILEGDLQMTYIGGRVEMSSKDLEKIMTALAIQPELNGVHDNYVRSIEKMMVDMAKLIDNKNEDNRFNLERILSVCASEHRTIKGREKGIIVPSRQVTEKDVIGKWRNSGVIDARQRFCYYVKKHTSKSLTAIGYFLSDRDHSTIIHSIDKVKDIMDVDEEYKSETLRIERIIVGGKIK